MIFFVNGKAHQPEKVHPSTTLLEYLRANGLTGTKLGCGEGGCGACTVTLSHFDHSTNDIVHRSVNACLFPLCAVDGHAVTTVEGIGSTKTKLHPVQERLSHSHGSQCGFCTPGIVMSMYTLLRNNSSPTPLEIEHAFDGNLCRCTGYRPILDAFKTFAEKDIPSKSSSGNCCGKCPKSCKEESKIGVTDIEDLFSSYSPDEHDLPFPAALKDWQAEELEIHAPSGSLVDSVWYRPISLDRLLYLKSKHRRDARIVVGNTELGIESKFKNATFPVLICPSSIPELSELSFVTADETRIKASDLDADTGVKVNSLWCGSSVTLGRLQTELTNALETLPSEKMDPVRSILENLRWFAGHQIRNAGAVGGNLATASPISDLNPVWQGGDAVIVVKSQNGERRVSADEFFISYRQVNLADDEVLLRVEVPLSRKFEYMRAFKQARRRDDDIAIVSAGMRLRLDATTCSDTTPRTRAFQIDSALLSYGGVAPITKRLKKVESLLVGRSLFEDNLVDSVLEALRDDIRLAANAPGGQVEYRYTLAASFFVQIYFVRKGTSCQRCCDQATRRGSIRR
eukprot:Rmarinus@m.10032